MGLDKAGRARGWGGGGREGLVGQGTLAGRLRRLFSTPRVGVSRRGGQEERAAEDTRGMSLAGVVAVQYVVDGISQRGGREGEIVRRRRRRARAGGVAVQFGVAG